MGTSESCARCWVLLVLLRIPSTAGSQPDNCSYLEINGLGPSDKGIEIQENSYINLTAQLKWRSGCDGNVNDTFQIKISYKENKFTVDLCKLILNKSCVQSDKSPCWCLNDSSVQLYKKVNRSDSRNYTWTWVNTGKPESGGRIEFFISIKEESSANTAIIPATCAFVGVVAAGAAGYFLWKQRIQCRVQRHRSSPTDVNVNCQEQETSQVEDSIYTDIKDENVRPFDDPYYADAENEVMSHLDDPVYIHIREEISRPGHHNFAHIQKQGMVQVDDPTYLHPKDQVDHSTYLHPKEENTSQPADHTYNHLRSSFR